MNRSTVFRWAICLSLAAFCPTGFSKDGPGNNGDPASFQVHDRGRFGLMKLRASGVVSKALLSVLELAMKDLVVDVDPTLQKLGEVRADVSRGGKRVVFVNPERFQNNFQLRHSSLDLTQWSLHEILETQIDPVTQRPYDVDAEITKSLHFDEKEFETWIASNRTTDRTKEKTRESWPVIGVYKSDNDVFARALSIDHDKQWEKFYLEDPKYRKSGLFATNDPSAPAKIELKRFMSPEGVTYWAPAEPVFYRHPGNWCRFQYFVEIRFFEDGFYLREKYPSESWGSGGDGCKLYHYEWRSHSHPYKNDSIFLGIILDSMIEREKDETRRQELRLLEGSMRIGKKVVRELLDEGVNPNTKDWRARTPLMLALWKGQPETVRELIPVSDLTASSHEGGVVDFARRNYAAMSMMKELVQGNPPPAILDGVFRWAAQDPARETFFLDLLERGPSQEALREALQSILNSCPREARSLGREALALRLFKLAKPEELGQFNALFTTALVAHDDFFWQLVQAGADPKAKGANGLTVLIGAVSGKRYELARRLIADGVDVNAVVKTDDYSYHALEVAIRTGDFEMAKILIPHANVDLPIQWWNQKPYPMTPLVYAALKLQEEKVYTAQIMQALVEKGADVKAKDVHGNTARDYLVKALASVSGNFRHFYPDDKNYQYFKQTFFWMRDSGKVPLGTQKEPGVLR